MLCSSGTILEQNQVELTVNGERMSVETRQETVQDLLNELNIPYKSQDRMNKNLSSPITFGDHIELVHTFPVTINVDGEERTQYTVGESVQDVINDLNLYIGDEDIVIPKLDAHVEAGDRIEIVRVHTEIETIEEPIEVQTVKVNDNTLLVGKEYVKQQGREGIRVLTVEKRYENGELVQSTVISEQVKQESEDRIIAVGTMQPVSILSAQSPNIKTITRDGMTFGVKKILDNVTLTAYDAGYNSTGKTSDHPEYGITYTGAKVKQGQTVAVDPDVIPLGWWIYIEGIGLRKAEDIGSAIKGKKIDVYFDSEEVANQFGVKKGYTVYVIGPNKPVEK